MFSSLFCFYFNVFIKTLQMSVNIVSTSSSILGIRCSILTILYARVFE